MHRSNHWEFESASGEPCHRLPDTISTAKKEKKGGKHVEYGKNPGEQKTMKGLSYTKNFSSVHSNNKKWNDYLHLSAVT